MRVPFIAAWAKPNANNPNQKKLPITAGAIQSQQAAVYDLFPTILTLTGKAIPADHLIDGLKLDTLLTGNRNTDREEVFLMHYPHSPHRTDYFTSYRNGNWKVIYHYFPSEVSENSHYQLFDLASDPFEQKNLAANNPIELKRIMHELITKMEMQKAQYPVEKDTKAPVKPKLPT
jgi:arylsulfatase A-like enzyme